MREIKFRAWDKVNKRYYQNIQNIFEKYLAFKDFLNNENMIVEQYTGLKDNNGTEIYEGDILRDPDDGTVIGCVEMTNYGKWECGGNDILDASDCDIIGNIHENVDLLVDDIERMIPDDIGNDIHEFLHGGDK